MQEIARIILDNEMDLILAHKRAMKLAEITGLSLSAQTSFATAVSEVARTAIEHGKRSQLNLGIEVGQREKYIVAALADEEFGGNAKKGLDYAKRLVNKTKVSTQGELTFIELFFAVPYNLRADVHTIDEWRTMFRNEPPVSPYEELKRKNEQLQELSDKLQKSETQYQTVTNALPLIIFSLDSNGQLLYANQWLQKFTGFSVKELDHTAWKDVVHENDYDAFSIIFKNKAVQAATAIRMQARLKSKASGDYLWHQASITPFWNDQNELQYWIAYLVDIHAQKVYEETLRDNQELKETQKKLEENQQTLQTYIAELNRSNYELQQFAFIASHDLQEPVRKLLYYSDFLLLHHAEQLDGRGARSIGAIHSAAQRMRNLIQDLLMFSQINKKQIELRDVDMNKVAGDALQDLELMISDKKAIVNVQPLPMIKGDEGMMRQVFENLISNALKYSSADRTPEININCVETNSMYEVAFADNGIGFDDKYLPQMFTLFQRLHSRDEYEGTGLGLAICRKITELHGGSIRAEGQEGRGATFYVSLPKTLTS